MNKDQQDEAAECIGHIRAGLSPSASILIRSFAAAALDRLEMLIANGHSAASHGKPKRARKKKSVEVVSVPSA